MINQSDEIGPSNLCIYYGKCGGCTLQHLDHREYKEYKMRGFDEVEFIELNNPFRRKLNLTFIKKNGRLILGLHAANSDDIINIRSCPASEPGISNLIPHLADFLEKNLIDRESGNLFLLKLQTGVVIKLLMKTDRGTLEIMNLSRKIKALRKFTEIISVKFYANNNLITPIMD